MSANIDSNIVSTATYVVDDAVGVANRYWYIGVVGTNTEKASLEKLGKFGVECYLPTQVEYKVRKNGRKAKVSRVVIPSTIFIKCTETERLKIVKFPFIKRFMIDRALMKSNSKANPIARVPEKEIELLRFMLDNSESPVAIADKPFRKGTAVKVIRGKLMGLEGEILEFNSTRTELVVALDIFGCAKLIIDSINVEPINL